MTLHLLFPLLYWLQLCSVVAFFGAAVTLVVNVVALVTTAVTLVVNVVALVTTAVTLVVATVVTISVVTLFISVITLVVTVVALVVVIVTVITPFVNLPLILSENKKQTHSHCHLLLDERNRNCPLVRGVKLFMSWFNTYCYMFQCRLRKA